MRSPAPRGFTMVEVMTVLGIIGVLAGLSAVALTRLKSRGNFASATGDFVATLRTARAEAFARGNNTVVVVDTAASRWWAIEDVNGSMSSISPSGFDGGVPAGDRLIYSGTLPSETSFGPANGPGTALAMPYCGIPTGTAVLAGSGTTCTVVADGGTTNPNLNYCSFCDTSGGKGMITFLPSGGARFSGGPDTVGQQISMQNTAGSSPDGGPSGTALGIIDFAIVRETGAIEAVTIK
ncbi:MAG: Tfp pilus assembly protein FimT/FimU [Myxococcales bacterium]|nr:prepilin-type N-terminal cleavage/methylation domain-containing protein [Myxococcales bacterium]